MSSKRILGIAGAAMIGTLAGVGVAHAVITIDNGEVKGAPTFAKETLRKDSARAPTGLGQGGGTYYEVAAHTGGSGELTVMVPIAVEVPISTTATISVNLTNLVTTGQPAFAATGNTPTLQVQRDGTAITGATYARITGGARGDRRYLMTVTTDATNAIQSSDDLVINLGRLGVDPDEVGTIAVNSSVTISGNEVSEGTSLPDAVKTMEMLTVGVTATDQTASIAKGFTEFNANRGTVSNGLLSASLGKIAFGLATTTTVYNAARGGPDDAPDGPRNTGSRAGTITAANQLVGAAEFVLTGGDTSFLGEDGELSFKETEDCSGSTTAATFSPDEDDDNKMKATIAVVPAEVYLCVTVDGETTIPATGPYTMNISLAGVHGATNTAFPPDDLTGSTFGSIGRDGTRVNIGHLTTNAGYNQRLVVVNRTGSDVTYSLEFETVTSRVTAIPGRGAEGTLSMGRNELSVRDLVTFDNQRMGGSGSAVMQMNAARGDIDVMTVTTRTTDGSTDTVVW